MKFGPWYSVKEVLPIMQYDDLFEIMYSGEVLLCYKDGRMMVGYLQYYPDDKILGWYDSSSECWDVTKSVVYWMNLPPQPE